MTSKNFSLTNSAVYRDIIESVGFAAEVLIENDYTEAYVTYDVKDIEVTTHIEDDGFVYFTAIDGENTEFLTNDPFELHTVLFEAIYL